MMLPQRRLLRRQHRERTPPTAPRLPATPSSLQTRNRSPTPTIRLEHRPSEATMSTMTSNPRKHGPATPRRKHTRGAIHSMHMLTRPQPLATLQAGFFAISLKARSKASCFSGYAPKKKKKKGGETCQQLTARVLNMHSPLQAVSPQNTSPSLPPRRPISNASLATPGTAACASPQAKSK